MDKSLLVFISNRGYANKAMELAKEFGATGGTIIHGKSSVTDEDKKFFKITIHPEKDMLLIVLKEENKKEIMKRIYNAFGSHTGANGIVFSLNVDELIGTVL